MIAAAMAVASHHRARLEALRRRACACEGEGDRAGALDAYEGALALDPDDAETLTALAQLALAMDLADASLGFWDRLEALAAGRAEVADGRARALEATGRGGDAVEVLRAAILAAPHEAGLWNTLGLLLDRAGDGAAALTFYDEALRLEPTLASALYNRGNLRFDQGELEAAEIDFDLAAPHARSPGDSARIALARALLHLHRGDLARGWDAYEARNHPDHPAAPRFEAPGEPLGPETPLKGLHLLAIGEQGVGDEVMFASLVPDLIAALEPEGLLSLAVDPRLVPLLARSFPQARIFARAGAREHGRVVRRAAAPPGRPVDSHAPLGSLARRLRRRIEAFAPVAYLAPDPGRVARFRAWLDEAAAGAPVVGLSWRSGLNAPGRARQYPSLSAFAPVLATPGVRFVDLQYGSTEDERASLSAMAARPLLVAPGLDVREDLDGVCALAVACGRLVTVPTATAALAAACGVESLMLSAPGAWPRLGTYGYPWYARATSFPAEDYGRWDRAMAAVAAAIRP